MSSRDFNDIIDFPQKIALQSLNIDVSKPLIAIVCAQSGLSVSYTHLTLPTNSLV